MWSKWSVGFTGKESETFDFIVYVILTVTLATSSCLLTLTTRTSFPGALEIKNVDEDLSLLPGNSRASSSTDPTAEANLAASNQPVAYYSAAGSGVAEVKVILSGFVIHVCTIGNSHPLQEISDLSIGIFGT